MSLLPGRIDTFSCFHIDTRIIADNFLELLEGSLPIWRSEVKAIWLHVPNNRLDLIPACQIFGFKPHHVSDTGVMLSLWLSHRVNTLPNYATHYIGAGGLIFRDETNQILVIKNKYNTIANITWKIPGGLVNKDQSICEGAVREVREQTGIIAEPLGILCFRQRTKYLFGMGDIYFLVLMNALSHQIIPDMEQTDQAKWMDIFQWLNIEQIGDSRQILREMIGDQENVKRGLQKKLLSRMTREVQGRNYQNIHTFHYFKL